MTDHPRSSLDEIRLPRKRPRRGAQAARGLRPVWGRVWHQPRPKLRDDAASFQLAKQPFSGPCSCSLVQHCSIHQIRASDTRIALADVTVPDQRAYWAAEKSAPIATISSLLKTDCSGLSHSFDRRTAAALESRLRLSASPVLHSHAMTHQKVWSLAGEAEGLVIADCKLSLRRR